MIVGGVGGRGGARVGGRGLVGRGDRVKGMVRGNDDDELNGLDWIGEMVSFLHILRWDGMECIFGSCICMKHDASGGN